MDLTHTGRLRTERLSSGYARQAVLSELSLSIPDDSFTIIVGPNACGKSTLLRTLARLMAPLTGTVLLDGTAISELPTREVARRVGLLPQSALAPDGITVAELVARGRSPHQSALRRWTEEDERATAAAMAATGVTELAGRRLDELSGGQRQRVWVALVLAQRTGILLLDEPTTFLDIAHQIDLMDLFARLHRDGATLLAVLHDLNQAARYATCLIVMKDGRVLAQGSPEEVVTPDVVQEAFGLRSVVVPDPVTGTPAVFPIGRPSP